MNNFEITVQTILALFGGITCIVGGISAIAKLFSPFKELKTRLDEHEQKLNKDYDRLNSVCDAIQDIEESNKVICKSILVLLNHQVTGNGIDKLKEQRDNLEQYLINK